MSSEMDGREWSEAEIDAKHRSVLLTFNALYGFFPSTEIIDDGPLSIAHFQKQTAWPLFDSDPEIGSEDPGSPGLEARICPDFTDEDIARAEKDAEGHINIDYMYDVRYRKSSKRDAITVRRALNLTIMDYALQIRQKYPEDLFPLLRESYANQVQRLQEKINKEWTGPREPPTPFSLEQWTNNFDDWRIDGDDDQGKMLQSLVDEVASKDEKFAEE